MAGTWTRWLLSGGVATWALGVGLASAEGYRHHQDHVLGTSLDFVASARSDQGQRALDAALAEIARLDPILSNWRSDSELAALNGATTFKASPDLFTVIARAERARLVTRNAFSPRLGAATARWREAVSRNDAPSAAELARLSSEAAQARVTLNGDRRTIEKPETLRFDLDAAAKGYIIDRALLAARQAAPDAHGFMLDIGGDIATWGQSPDGGAWRVGVAASGYTPDNGPALQSLNLRGHAIAVSGAGARDLIVSGERYPHLLSADGWSSRENLSAAVIAPTAQQADALSTALAVLPAQDGLALIAGMPSSAAQIVDAQGQIYGSANWSSFVAAEQCQAAAASPWPPQLSVSASFELPRMSGTTKAYVAVWVTDAQRNVVRTLLVLGDTARWRESNYVFWRRVERMDLAAVQAMARPSRAPGRYTVEWDGRTNAGEPAPQGQYTLNIEVSREHGSHNLQTIPLTLGADAVTGEAAAQDEVGLTQVRYGRAT